MSTTPGGWWSVGRMPGDHGLLPVEPVSASYTMCAVTIMLVRRVNPNLPAAEGTQRVDES